MAALVSVPPVLIGFVNLARHLSDALIQSVALLGMWLFLHSIIVGGILALMRRSKADEDLSPTVLPFIVGWFLTLAALPVLAIVWGARTTDVSKV